jgi:predicted nucleotidyltransferase
VATQFDTIFAVLQRTGVRYVVVGGVAVNLHGYQRFTKDVDLVIELVADRALKALQALEAIGYKPTVPVKLTDFADPAIREGWIRDKGMVVFQMYSDQTRMSIDVFVQYPLDFDELWDRGTKIDLPGTSLRIASIDHLILMKRKASRPQDLLDIEQLEKIKRLLDEQGDVLP